MYQLKFYLPFMYSVETRMSKNLNGVLNWISQYIIPVILIIWLNESTIDWLVFITSLLLVYNLYEIGYIQNDTETIKKEANPTLRLKTNEFEYYEIHKTSIYTSRLLIGILFSIILITVFNVKYFPIYLAWLIPVIYQIYNYFRAGYIYFLHFILMEIRYIIPILSCVNYLSFGDWVLVALMYPLPSIIVKLLKKNVIYNKFFLKYIGSYSTRYLFIIKYYLFILILNFSIWYLYKEINLLQNTIIISYYLIRSILFYIIFGKKNPLL